LIFRPSNDPQELAITQKKPLDVNIINAPDRRPFFDRLTHPEINPDANPSFLMTAVEKNTVLKQQQRLIRAMNRLPAVLPYNNLDNPPTKLSVPIGQDSETKEILLADFDSDTLHVLIAGFTGSGKDALLRLWFST